MGEWRDAVHEAGHAVAAVLLDGSLGVIDLDEGETWCGSDDGLKEGAIAAAGKAGQAIVLLSGIGFYSNADREQLREGAEKAGVSTGKCYALAYRTLATAPAIRAMKSLAKELIERRRIEGVDAKKIILEAMK